MIPGLTPSDIGLPPKFTSWRPNQILGLTRGCASKKTYQAHSMPVGDGKSAFYVAQALFTSTRTCILTSTKGLQDQLVKDFSPIGLVDMRGRNNYPCIDKDCRNCEEGQYHRCPPEDCSYEIHRKRMLEAPLVVSNYAYYTRSYRYGRGMGDFDLLIIDECFVAGTLIDGRPIESIKIGDYVWAMDYDTNRGAFKKKKVTRLYKSEAKILVKVTLTNGDNFVCTLNHPIFTNEGWVSAIELSPRMYCAKHETNYLSRSGRDTLCESELQEPVDPDRRQKETRVQEVGTGGMQPNLRVGPSPATREDERGASTFSSTHASSESNEERRFQTENVGDLETDRASSKDSGRKRSWANRAATFLARRTKLALDWLLLGSRDSDIQWEVNEGLPLELQSGYHLLGSEDRDRSGRRESQVSGTSTTGQEERKAISWIGVDCIEIYESTDPDRFREVCPDGFVYNFEVEDFHTYTANNYVVHNCHDAPDEVCAAMAVEIHYWEGAKIGINLPRDGSLEDWHDWAELASTVVIDKLEDLKLALEADKADRGKPHISTIKELRFWNSVSAKVQSILEAVGDWAIERIGDGYKLEPIWARDYAKQILFREIPKIVLVSATMVKKTIDLLGIPDEEIDFFTYASSFPAQRSPVYLYGACQISHRTTDDNLVLWLTRINNIIRRRLDRKGIIHSVSYERAKFIRNNSEFADIMIVPEKGTETAAAIEKFKRAKAPSILISPAITTGLDFSYSLAEYNLIVKVPFLDTRGQVLSARQEQDKEYAPYITAQTIVQAAGRSMRAGDDQSECFILDSNIDWFIRRHSDLFPFWFHRLISRPRVMPEPPSPLNRDPVLSTTGMEEAKLLTSIAPIANSNEEPF